MSRQLDLKREELQAKRDYEVLAAVEFELVGSIAHVGGVLRGFSVKIGEGDTLLTLRADFEGSSMVAFVGSPDIGSCLRKAVHQVFSNEVNWKADEWANR